MNILRNKDMFDKAIGNNYFERIHVIAYFNIIDE